MTDTATTATTLTTLITISAYGIWPRLHCYTVTLDMSIGSVQRMQNPFLPPVARAFYYIEWMSDTMLVCPQLQGNAFAHFSVYAWRALFVYAHPVSNPIACSSDCAPSVRFYGAV